MVFVQSHWTYGMYTQDPSMHIGDASREPGYVQCPPLSSVMHSVALANVPWCDRAAAQDKNKLN